MMDKGLATSAALTVPHIDPKKRVGIAISPAFVNEEAAVGVGAAIRLDDTWQFGGSIATDVAVAGMAGAPLGEAV